MKAKTPSVAKEPNRKALPISADVPNNPRAALELFLNLHSRQKERRDSVGEDYARRIQISKNLFVQYGHPELANNLPDFPQEAPPTKTAQQMRLPLAAHSRQHPVGYPRKELKPKWRKIRRIYPLP